MCGTLAFILALRIDGRVCAKVIGNFQLSLTELEETVNVFVFLSHSLSWFLIAPKVSLLDGKSLGSKLEKLRSLETTRDSKMQEEHRAFQLLSYFLSLLPLLSLSLSRQGYNLVGREKGKSRVFILKKTNAIIIDRQASGLTDRRAPERGGPMGREKYTAARLSCLLLSWLLARPWRAPTTFALNSWLTLVTSSSCSKRTSFRVLFSCVRLGSV